MDYHEHYPQNFLKEYINKFWYVRGALGHRIEKIFPMQYIFLIVNLGDPYKLFKDSTLESYVVNDKAWISGLQNKYLIIENPEIVHNIGIEFNPGAVHFFTDYNQEELSNSVRPTSEVFTDDFLTVREMSLKGLSVEELFLKLEKILIKLFKEQSAKNYSTVKRAVELISKNSETRIGSLSKQLGVSEKHLHHLFNEFVGISPKKLKDIYKFQSLVNLIGKDRPKSWAELATSFNFYDQPHFGKVFKIFTGFTPNEYIRILNENDSGYVNFVAMDKK